jgi:hypothetical protein
MKIIGIVVGAALLTAAPFSMHCTPKKAALYVDRADAQSTVAAHLTGTMTFCITATVAISC